MYISDVRIENYRTFQDVTFHFDSRANYIVGDNNIGKSNFLSFLKTVTHGYGFREADFLDENNPIRVFFTLSSADMMHDLPVEQASGESSSLPVVKLGWPFVGENYNMNSFPECSWSQ